MSYYGQVELIDKLTGITTSNIIRELGSDIFLALPFFQAFTGFDTVSSFYGKGKCKAYDVWIKIERKDDFTDVFIKLGEKPTDGTSDHIDILDRFLLQLDGSIHDKLGAARLGKFKTSTDIDFRLLPSSKEAPPKYLSCFLSSWVFLETVCRRTRYS